jgi:hypothetical protein
MSENLAMAAPFAAEPENRAIPDTLPAVDLDLSPSDSFVTLTNAIHNLQDEVTAFREERERNLQDMAAMRQRITSLEQRQEEDASRICCDIAYDRQRLAKLEKGELQPLQRDRGDILKALIAANGGKMLAMDARKKMHLAKNRFSELLKTCDFVEKKPSHIDRRKDIIILK